MTKFTITLLYQRKMHVIKTKKLSEQFCSTRSLKNGLNSSTKNLHGNSMNSLHYINVFCRDSKVIFISYESQKFRYKSWIKVFGTKRLLILISIDIHFSRRMACTMLSVETKWIHRVVVEICKKNFGGGSDSTPLPQEIEEIWNPFEVGQKISEIILTLNKG